MKGEGRGSADEKKRRRENPRGTRIAEKGSVRTNTERGNAENNNMEENMKERRKIWERKNT